MFLFLQVDKKQKIPADTKAQPSSLSPVRNPFKASEKVDKSKVKQSSEGDVTDSQKSHKNEARKSDRKELEESTGGEAEEDKENGKKLNLADTYRGKPLPAGMKMKKRLSDEERDASKANSVAKTAEEVKSKLGETQPDKESKTPHVTYKDSNQQPAPTKSCAVDQKQTVEKELSSKDTRGSTESYCGSAKATSDQQGHCDDKNSEDDDDVVLVSVKPAAQTTSPASAVQKTITTFPGFQTASKVKGQQPDPRGLRNLLTAQLEQKKVSEELTGKCC